MSASTDTPVLPLATSITPVAPTAPLLALPAPPPVLLLPASFPFILERRTEMACDPPRHWYPPEEGWVIEKCPRVTPDTEFRWYTFVRKVYL